MYFNTIEIYLSKGFYHCQSQTKLVQEKLVKTYFSFFVKKPLKIKNLFSATLIKKFDKLQPSGIASVIYNIKVCYPYLLSVSSASI